jgi:hypothetical protein
MRHTQNKAKGEITVLKPKVRGRPADKDNGSRM